MSARSPTEVYLCVSLPLISPVTTSTPAQRGLLKFTDMTQSNDIQWLIVEAGNGYT